MGVNVKERIKRFLEPDGNKGRQSNSWENDIAIVSREEVSLDGKSLLKNIGSLDRARTLAETTGRWVLKKPRDRVELLIGLGLLVTGKRVPGTIMVQEDSSLFTTGFNMVSGGVEKAFSIGHKKQTSMPNGVSWATYDLIRQLEVAETALKDHFCPTLVYTETPFSDVFLGGGDSQTEIVFVQPFLPDFVTIEAEKHIDDGAGFIDDLITGIIDKTREVFKKYGIVVDVIGDSGYRFLKRHKNRVNSRSELGTKQAFQFLSNALSNIKWDPIKGIWVSIDPIGFFPRGWLHRGSGRLRLSQELEALEEIRQYLLRGIR